MATTTIKNKFGHLIGPVLSVFQALFAKFNEFCACLDPKSSVFTKFEGINTLPSKYEINLAQRKKRKNIK